MGVLNNHFLLSNFTTRTASVGLAAVISVLGVNAVNASPTSNEFEECHVLASKRLLRCLNENMNSIHIGQCWPKSKSSYDSCHTKVMKRHDRSEMKKRRELAEAIEAEMLNEQAKTKE